MLSTLAAIETDTDEPVLKLSADTTLACCCKRVTALQFPMDNEAFLFAVSPSQDEGGNITKNQVSFALQFRFSAELGRCTPSFYQFFQSSSEYRGRTKKALRKYCVARSLSWIDYMGLRSRVDSHWMQLKTGCATQAQGHQK